MLRGATNHDHRYATPKRNAMTPSNAPESVSAPFQVRTHALEGTPENIEREWFETIYHGRGDTLAQLTWRAVMMGSVLGGILSLTNLYVGLKAGWGFGVAITACILSYAIWSGFLKLGVARTPMTFGQAF
jgi:hypothetical protein